MQVGSFSPFTSKQSLADAMRYGDKESKTSPDSMKEQDKDSILEDQGGSVEQKDPISALKEKLAKDNEPSALEKLRSKIAESAVSKLQGLAQRFNNAKPNGSPSLSDVLRDKNAKDKKQETDKDKETTENKPADKLQSKPNSGVQNVLGGLTLKDLNTVAMTSFTSSSAASYEAKYDSQTGVASQELAYTQTYSFTFSGTVVDKNGTKYNIEANVTLTHSLYSKITGGQDTLDPKVLEALQNGDPFNFDYEGDGSDLKDQNFGFLFDDYGSSDQLSSKDSIFGGLIDKAFGEGLGSLLEGLRVFTLGGSDSQTPMPLPELPQEENADMNKYMPVLNQNNNNAPSGIKDLIALGEQGIGMVFITQMQRELLFQYSKDSSSFSASFRSTSVSYYSGKTQTLEELLEQQKQRQNGIDPKKAMQAYQAVKA